MNTILFCSPYEYIIIPEEEFIRHFDFYQVFIKGDNLLAFNRRLTAIARNSDDADVFADEKISDNCYRFSFSLTSPKSSFDIFCYLDPEFLIVFFIRRKAK